MRWLLLSFAAAFASPVGAQSLAVDQTYVRQCHVSAATAETQPTCLGDASNLCQNLAGGDTTIGISQCIQAETAVWDMLLNEEYRLTKFAFAQLDNGLSEALLTAQRAWVAYRDAECSLRYTRWQGGTIRSIVHASCLMGFTSTRAIELRDMRGDGS